MCLTKMKIKLHKHVFFPLRKPALNSKDSHKKLLFYDALNLGLCNGVLKFKSKVIASQEKQAETHNRLCLGKWVLQTALYTV